MQLQILFVREVK